MRKYNYFRIRILFIGILIILFVSGCIAFFSFNSVPTPISEDNTSIELLNQYNIDSIDFLFQYEFMQRYDEIKIVQNFTKFDDLIALRITDQISHYDKDFFQTPGFYTEDYDETSLKSTERLEDSAALYSSIGIKEENITNGGFYYATLREANNMAVTTQLIHWCLCKSEDNTSTSLYVWALIPIYYLR